MDADRLRRTLAQAADQFATAGSPLYAALARMATADADLLAIAAEVPRGQLVGGLLMAAVHFELLANPADALADWFRSLRAAPRAPDLAGPAFRRFCLAHRDAIIHTLRTRPLQTTSPVRSTAILPALACAVTATTAAATAQHGDTVSLVELGCGAGFNLIFDAFRHRYRRADGTCFVAARDAAAHVPDGDLECSLRSSAAATELRPFAMPTFVARAGIDLRPPDLDDATERRWLQALGFPEDVAHARQLMRAVEIRRRTPVRVERGDALDLLPQVAASLPGVLCVLHVNCLYQWPAARREALEAWLLAASHARPIHRIAMERLSPLPDALRELATPASIPPCDLVHEVYERGRAERRLLGYAEGFGRWLEWRA